MARSSAAEHASERAPAADRATLWRLAWVSLALCLVLKLPSLAFPIAERDELIYWTLGHQLASGAAYSLEGKVQSLRLSPYVYERPLFHHPPLLPALLAPFAAMDAPRAARMVGWLGHVLMILALSIWCDTRRISGRALPGGASLALLFLVLAVDPLFVFVSGKLWIDGLMAGLIALSYALLDRAAVQATRPALLVSGALALGGAGLAKLPALMAGLVAAVRLSRQDAPAGRAYRSVGIVALIAAAVVAPWLVRFYAVYGRLTPDWIAGENLRGASAFVSATLDRPWWYLLAQLSFAEPLLPVLLAFLLIKPSRVVQEPALWIWILIFVTVPTLMGLGGYGFQTRFVTAAVPPILMLGLADVIPEIERSSPRLTHCLLVLMLLWGAWSSFPYFFEWQPAELAMPPERLGWIDLKG